MNAATATVPMIMARKTSCVGELVFMATRVPEEMENSESRDAFGARHGQPLSRAPLEIWEDDRNSEDREDGPLIVKGDWMSTGEIARELSIHVNTVIAYVEQGLFDEPIKHRKLAGGHRRVHKESFERFRAEIDGTSG